MPTQPGDRLSQPRHRVVVGCTIEPWPAVPCGGQPQPGDALLRGLDAVEPLAAERQAEPADLADRLGARPRTAPVVVDQRVRALLAAGLLVGHERQHDVARGRRPSCVSWRTTASIIASMSFMSIAPRPQTQPSAISPENGSTASRRRWPVRRRGGRGSSEGGRRSASRPSIRVTRLVRFGCDSSTVGLEADVGELARRRIRPPRVRRGRTGRRSWTVSIRIRSLAELDDLVLVRSHRSLPSSLSSHAGLAVRLPRAAGTGDWGFA